MNTAVFSSKSYDRTFLDAAARDAGHQLQHFENRLRAETAPLAAGKDAVVPFVNDVLDRPCLERLVEGGTRFIAMRCAGFNNLDLDALTGLGLRAARVPAYSPYAVAEHTFALLMALERKTHKAYNRVREGNFLIEGLMGRDLHGLTAGVIGTGLIGRCFISILRGLGCRILAHDVRRNEETERLGARHVDMDELVRQSDILSLHCPLVPETYHLLHDDVFDQMKPGVVVLNTSRGALIDAGAAVRALKSGRLGGLGLDVYEEEESLFFRDHSGDIIHDDLFVRLISFPNVLITSHQAYFTSNAMKTIASTTMENLTCFERGEPCPHDIRLS